MSYEFLKRIFDIFFCPIYDNSFITIIDIHLFINFLFDNGPVIFKQVRVGENGNILQFINLGSMKYIKDYKFDGLINELSKETIKNARERFKTTKKNDSRISRIGRFIRPIHIDELPQL